MSNYSIRIPDDTLEKMRYVAHKKNIAVSDLINGLCDKYVQHKTAQGEIPAELPTFEYRTRTGRKPNPDKPKKRKLTPAEEQQAMHLAWLKDAIKQLTVKVEADPSNWFNANALREYKAELEQITNPQP